MSAYVISSTEIKVTWNELLPIKINGPLYGYDVKYSCIYNNCLETTTFTDETSLIIAGLLKGVLYSISVRTITEEPRDNQILHLGPFSNAVDVTIPGNHIHIRYNY